VEQSTAALEARIGQLTRELADARAVIQTRAEERDQARSERDEARRQQTATADVLKVMNRSGFDLQAVFETLVDLAARLCRAERATILRLDGGCFTLVASCGMAAGYTESMQANPVRLDRGSISGRAVLDGRPVHVPDVLADPEFTRHETQRLGGFRSALAAPLMREGSAIGSIFLTRAVVDPFTKQEIELITTFADQAVIAIQNTRLFEEVQTRTRELTEALEQQTATSELLQVISRSKFDLQPVLEAIVDTAARLCDTEQAFVFERDGDVFRLAVNHGFSEEYEHFLRDRPIPFGRGTLVGRTALTASIVHLPDARADPEYTWSVSLELGKQRTALGVPLLRDGVPVGVIALARTYVKPFSERQIQLLSTFADQAVIALENVRLFEEVQESLAYQTATAEVLNVISRSPSQIQPVLDAIVETAGKLCEAEFALAFRLGEDGQLHLVANSQTDRRYLEFLREHPVPLSVGTATGRAALERRTVHIPDAVVDPDFTWSEWVALTGARTFLGVPLLSRDGISLGVIALVRTAVRPFNRKQIDLVTTFADQAVIAIENVRLFEEVQARTREVQEALEYQTAASNVLGVISGSPNALQPVLDAIVRIATELCEGFDATIMLREGEALRVGAHHGSIPLDFTTKAISAGWITGRAVLHGAPVHVHDFALEERDFPEGYELSKRHGHRTGLAIPLIREGEAIGAFMIRRLEVAPFSDKQIQVLLTFADQAVIAINNVRLFEEVQARTEELREALQQQTATADVLKTISRSTLDLQTVLQTLVESAARLCNAEQASITRQRDGVLYRAEFYGFSDEFIAHARSIPIKPGPGSVIGRALLEGRIVHISDVQADPEYTWVEARNLGGFRTILGVPMMREGTPIGVLTLSRLEPRPFTERQIELVSTFADQAAIAIENVRLFEQVQARTEQLGRSLEELRAAQDRLVETQKLAALGQLTAGVAHEIKNPLNFVNNFADLSAELIDELKEVLASGRPDTISEADELATVIKGNLEKVVQHGRRADSIVKNMLLHSRQGSGERHEVAINAIAEESLNLAYHGARAEQPSFNVRLTTALDPNAGTIEAYPQELARVLLNVISNAFHAVHKREREGGEAGYAPEVNLTTTGLADAVEVRVHDNGTGISDDVRARMFDPFFTTKPPGEGTGLGLSLSHDIIVKQHGGRIDVDSRVGEFSEFVITLPRRDGSAAGPGAGP
jgi:two-component system, NtrC family, sensor kinase